MRIHTLSAILLLSAVAATAQENGTPRVEVGLNYSWLHVNSANFDYQRTGNGGWLCGIQPHPGSWSRL